MTINGNHNVNPQPTPNNIGIGNQPQIGGAPVQQGGFGAIRRALSDIGHKIQDFFAGIATKFENWQEGRAIKQATTKANAAAESVVAGLVNPGINPDTMGQLDSLMKYSARVNPGDPDGFAKQLLKDKAMELPPDQRSSLSSTDFKALGDNLKTLQDSRIDQLVDMEARLEDTGLGGGVSDGKQLKANAHARIDTSIGILSDVGKEVRLTELRELGKGVFTIDNSGFVSGTVTNAKMSPQLTQGGAQNPIELILDDGKQKIAPGKTTQVDVGGVQIPINNKALADLPRMNFQFDVNGSQYNSKTLDANSSVGQLRQFSGSDKATTVLSGVMGQYPLREVVTSFEGENGKAVLLKPIPNHYGKAEVHLPNGQVETFDKPGQIGEAKISMSKLPNGDFKVDVDWEYLTTTVTNGGDLGKFDNKNPTHGPNSPQEGAGVTLNCIKVHMTGSYTISGSEANKGNLVILPGGSFQHSFSGKIGLT